MPDKARDVRCDVRCILVVLCGENGGFYCVMDYLRLGCILRGSSRKSRDGISQDLDRSACDITMRIGRR